MKKVLFLALAVVASASFTTVAAGKKDKKVKQENTTEVAAPVVLKSAHDSLSYAAGYQMTNGLMQFLLQSKMDTTYMADFIKGIKESNTKKEDPSFKAYSLGLNISSQLNDRMIPGISGELKEGGDSLDTNLFFEGFYASLSNDSTKYTQKGAEEYFRAKMKAISDMKAAKKKAEDEKNKKAGEDWLAQNKAKEGVITLPSGLQYKVLTQGTGITPNAADEVTVKYEGKLIDGTVFDSSYTRKEQTNKFKANQVIKGWTEALTLMPVGSTYELYIPQNLAYGERQAGKIPPYSTLIFKVELVDCTPAATTTTTTTDKAASKDDSKKLTPKQRAAKEKELKEYAKKKIAEGMAKKAAAEKK